MRVDDVEGLPLGQLQRQPGVPVNLAHQVAAVVCDGPGDKGAGLGYLGRHGAGHLRRGGLAQGDLREEKFLDGFTKSFRRAVGLK